MVHIFMYVSPPESIDSIGALQILPRSQYAFWDSGAAGQLFGALTKPLTELVHEETTPPGITFPEAALLGRATARRGQDPRGADRPCRGQEAGRACLARRRHGRRPTSGLDVPGRRPAPTNRRTAVRS